MKPLQVDNTEDTAAFSWYLYLSNKNKAIKAQKQ